MEIVYYPDPRLREPAKPVEKIDDDLRKTAEEMFKVMEKHKGVGLAGTQIGYGRRVIVANVTGKKDDDVVYINPVFLKKSGEVREEEGCLSFPGVTATIVRAESVVVEFTTLEGKRRRVEAEGLASRMFQHEIDHLDGILFIDKMSPAERIASAGVLKQLEEDFRKNRRKAFASRKSGVDL